MPDAPTPDTQTPEPRNQELATAAQIEAMENLDIDFDLPITKREASEKIEKAKLKLDARDLARMQSKVDMRRIAYDSLKLNHEIAESGFGDEIEGELAQLRQTGRSAKRQSKRSR